MSERIRTFLAVTILTIAVWVWADLEQTGKDEDVVLPVTVSVPKDYRIRGITPGRLTVTLKGPEGEIQRLKSAPEDRVCRFNLTEADLAANPLVLSAREGLEHLSDAYRIAATDVRDAQAKPFDGKILADITRLVEVRNVRVEVQVTGAVASAATARPPEVTARVAEPDLAGFPDAKRFVVAPLDVDTVPEDLVVEQEVTLDRHLGGPDGIDAAFEPPIVTVTARLQAAVTQRNLGRFPILISGPPEVLNRYRVVFQQDAERWVELEVEGPGPAVERLRPQDLRVTLTLTEDDKPSPGSWLPGQPAVIGLPASVKLTKPLRPVNFNLEKFPEKPSTP
jgi:hypothetical protein